MLSENNVIPDEIRDPENNETDSGSPHQDTEPPVIELRGNNPITLDKNARFLDPGVGLSDNETEDIHIRLETTGDDIDTSIPGTYTISYKATDLAGNTSTAERAVEVTPLSGVIPDEILDPSESVDVSESIRDPEESETSQNTPNNSSDSTGQVETEEPATAEEDTIVEENSLLPQESQETTTTESPPTEQNKPL